MISEPTYTTNLDSRQSVVLYPSFGYLTDAGATWRIGVRGMVYDARAVRLRQRLMLRLLQRAMKAPDEAFRSELFQERIRGFVAGAEKGKRVALRVGSRVFQIRKKSKRNGQFQGVLRLSTEEVESLRAGGDYDGDWLNFEIATGNGDYRRFHGRAQFIADQGVSIVSDIDDTIKHTNVTCRRSLLENTFLREFTAIDGMAPLYRGWAAAGAVFHYVSSSPWQLYMPLAELCDREAFPQGAFHLRSFRLRDHMLRRMLLIRRPGKGAVIRSLIRTFPNRRFVLIGDSGEHDPELYGDIARKYPGCISAILIRDLPERKLTSLRRDRAFRHAPGVICRTFQSAEQLQDLDWFAAVEPRPQLLAPG